MSTKPERSTPKVYLLSESRLPSGSFDSVQWLKDLGCEIDEITAFGDMDMTEPEMLIWFAAKRCYKSFNVKMNPNITKVRTDPRDFFDNILRSGHGSVLEHASATFAIEGCSRVFTHELVRHRAGCAYSQESLRYVRPTKLKYFNAAVGSTGAQDIIEDEIQRCFQFVGDAYKRLEEKLFHEGMDFDRKKKLTSAMRRLLPIGMATGIVFTANFRALRHIIQMRTTSSAEYEIWTIMHMIKKIAVERWPLVFGDLALPVSPYKKV